MTNVKGARLENAHVGFCNLKVEGYITNVQLVTATNSMMWIGFDITDRSGFTTNIRIVHEPVNIDIMTDEFTIPNPLGNNRIKITSVLQRYYMFLLGLLARYVTVSPVECRKSSYTAKRSSRNALQSVK